ncbi:FxsA family protein [Aureimonas sp. AU12]|uniref:FxsA family protein n=1 Tax=Aureimonas sp. AU12 TaxID=1638161 RepID=UPI0007809EEB|nr:FxsA family protein [Aureimonas sp. AU12]
MPLILVPLALLALPLLEIGVFIWVGNHIGVGWTLALVLLSVVVGATLLKRQTLSTLAAARATARAGRVPDREIAHGAMIALAGILLVLPGFVTDIAGLLLFLPPVRDLVWNAVRRRIRVVEVGGRNGPVRPYEPAPDVLDLSGAEFTRRDDGSPWVRIDDASRRKPGGRDDTPTVH